MKKVCKYSLILACLLIALYAVKLIFSLNAGNVGSIWIFLRTVAASSCLIAFWAMLFHAAPRRSPVKWLCVGEILTHVLVIFISSCIDVLGPSSTIINILIILETVMSFAFAAWLVWFFRKGSRIRKVALANVIVCTLATIITAVLGYIPGIGHNASVLVEFLSILLCAVFTVRFFILFSALERHKDDWLGETKVQLFY